MRWYKQDSGLFDRPWTVDAKAVSLYVYLHCAAYVNDKRLLNGQIIRRGSCPVKYEDIAERTKLTVKEIRLRLKLLAECGEVIVKRTNRGVIVTVCDYDACNTSEDLFETNRADKGQSKGNLGTIQGQSEGNHYTNIEYKNIDNKIKRENKALIYEIKDLYNRRFAGKLPEWKRLSEKMVIRVDNCVTRYGRQSVDMVFDQIEHEPFSLGENKTGFIADAFFIFTLEQYEKYLGRYKLRVSKKDKPAADATGTVEGVGRPPAGKSVGVMAEKPPEPTKEEKRRVLLMQWVEDYRKIPTARNLEILTAAYESGELNRLGIDWQPNIQ